MIKSDLVGVRFGRLVVTAEAGRDKHKNKIWECVCDCGSICKTNTGNLKTGAVKSCGCLRRQVSAEKARGNRREHTAVGKKLCGICQEEKVLTKFYKQEKTWDGLSTVCKACSLHRRDSWSERKLEDDPEYFNKKASEWRAKNPDKAKEHRRKSQLKYRYTQYGLTKESFEKLLAEQGGVCGLCCSVPDDGVWHIDHDSAFGKIDGRRGILCRACNTGIGMFKHDPERLELAIAYLDKWSEELFQTISPSSSL